MNFSFSQLPMMPLKERALQSHGHVRQSITHTITALSANSNDSHNKHKRRETKRITCDLIVVGRTFFVAKVDSCGDFTVLLWVDKRIRFAIHVFWKFRHPHQPFSYIVRTVLSLYFRYIFITIGFCVQWDLIQMHTIRCLRCVEEQWERILRARQRGCERGGQHNSVW